MLSYWLLVKLLIMRQTHWLFPNHIPFVIRLYVCH